MSLTLQSFGSRLSFEMIRDGVVIGGLAYASNMRSPKGNAAFASAKAHVHGMDVEIAARNTNTLQGKLEFYILKDNQRIGALYFDWKGKGTLKLSRVDGREDKFRIKPKGVSNWWFLVERDHYPVVELRPTTKYNREEYNFEVRKRNRRIPERAIDELCLYVGFAANVYMAKMAGVTGRR